VWLTVLGLLNSAVAAYYYLRLLVVMYMYEPGETVGNLEPLTPGLRVAMILSAAGTFVLGVSAGRGAELCAALHHIRFCGIQARILK